MRKATKGWRGGAAVAGRLGGRRRCAGTADLSQILDPYDPAHRFLVAFGSFVASCVFRVAVTEALELRIGVVLVGFELWLFH